MPRTLTQYRIFIASPGGLEQERERFRTRLLSFTEKHAEPNGALYHPVGWEETLPSAGRPQELINEDLRQCDFAVFVLHNRWGTSSGPDYTSGTEEEWHVAEKLYEEGKIRNIMLFFKKVDDAQLKDPGQQLQKVLDFKAKIESGRKYLFKAYSGIDDFDDILEKHLAGFLRDHQRSTNPDANPESALDYTPKDDKGVKGAPSPDPGFDFWMKSANDSLYETKPADPAGALFCARRAIGAAGPDGLKQAKAWLRAAVAERELGQLDDSLNSCSRAIDLLPRPTTADTRTELVSALFGKAYTLGTMGRREEEIAGYEDVVSRFGTATEPAIREQVAKVLRNKGVALGTLGRSEEEIRVYDDLLARFGAATEPVIREQVAVALVNKGYRLGTLGRSEEEIRAYDDLLARFGTATEPAIREQVAKALRNKGVALGTLGRSEEAIRAYDDLLARFSTVPEPAIREQVAAALVNKGFALGTLGRSEEEIRVYDDLLARFSTVPEPAIREQVAVALRNKGYRLGTLGRSEEAIRAYDDLLARFSTATEPAIREQVAGALVNKGITLGTLNRGEAAIAVYDDVLTRFGTATEPAIQEQVANAQKLRELIRKP